MWLQCQGAQVCLGPCGRVGWRDTPPSPKNTDREPPEKERQTIVFSEKNKGWSQIGACNVFFAHPFPRCVPTVHSFCAKFRYILRKRDIDDTKVRLTLQHTGFRTQGLVLGIPPKILKKGLFLRWAMRYHRE